MGHLVNHDNYQKFKKVRLTVKARRDFSKSPKGELERLVAEHSFYGILTKGLNSGAFVVWYTENNNKILIPMGPDQMYIIFTNDWIEYFEDYNIEDIIINLEKLERKL